MHKIKLIVTDDLEKRALHKSLKRFFQSNVMVNMLNGKPQEGLIAQQAFDCVH
jgi:hypothetical protein